MVELYKNIENIVEFSWSAITFIICYNFYQLISFKKYILVCLKSEICPKLDSLRSDENESLLELI